MSKNTLETKVFYTLPLSLKILLNLCLELSCKQDATERTLRRRGCGTN